METAENKGGVPRQPQRVLLLYYSFSGQTMGLLNRLAVGLKEQGVEVVMEKLRPVEPLRFPIGTVMATFKMMIITLFRRRVAIEELSDVCRQEFELIILAGPTWSYNPSGPILTMLDRDGPVLLRDRVVLPLISCRGYWRMHWYGLRSILRRCGAAVPNYMVFSHPSPEPWRTIGVFLKLAGKNPERAMLIGRYYRRFGHTRQQMDEAWSFGRMIGEALQNGTPLAGFNFLNKISVP
ncbi:MAG: hypothetical protein A2521_02720 [Deltaproteobacteria bacterium RIFOXYD12_FULL_57_12]|nr:MAG: hypothetical protein A2521_02720 [Deltaproteobacteria bacterium RIFOXYD12_FULL_57_12]